MDPFSEPFAYVRAVLVRAPILLADQLATPRSSIVLFLPPSGVNALWVWGMIVLIGCPGAVPGTVRLHITRPEERRLAIRPEGEFLGLPFDNLFRGDLHPFLLGQ